MSSLEALARQIDAAVEVAKNDALRESDGTEEGLRRMAHDPNQEESTVHVEALLRYPDAVAAIRLVSSDTRTFLAAFLEGEEEFRSITDEIQSLGA